MKYFYFITTLLFWLTVAGFWVARSWTTTEFAAYADPQTLYSLNDVAEHNHQADCWMTIHGQVYDLTAYLPQHPAASHVILPFCGTQASHAYDTKNRDRPHSDEADALLAQYRIGILDH